ncbi:hypothetical protein J2Z40_003898 [Cytobacillus eiseniae]|uniref:Uncharacterized protein n=1 Tax=Cytobacillus eiseniae TaxID=762947 RepID=A0ABS4RLY9_9BACI|nr:hypothetical protein [Cytobacillus eiseniae]MBP2243299.1 hypothetical protein [Cytobacillus eiseniae]
MAIASKLTAVGILVISIALGFLSFYLFSECPKEQKKKHLEELTSLLINFVVFIWLGKIVLNLSVFILDPLSILAYPSDSSSFYFAITLLVLLLFYKAKRKRMHVLPLLESFAFVFLISSFVYECIQVVLENHPYAFGYLLLLALLIMGFFFLREHLTISLILILLITAWSFGILLLAITQPFVTVFGYMMAPWFIGIFFITSVGSLLYRLRKRRL